MYFGSEIEYDFFPKKNITCKDRTEFICAMLDT